MTKQEKQKSEGRPNTTQPSPSNNEEAVDHLVILYNLPICAVRLVLAELARGAGMAYYQKLPRTEFNGDDLWTVQRNFDGTIGLILQPSRVAEVDEILYLRSLEMKLGNEHAKKGDAVKHLKAMETQPESIQKRETVFISNMESRKDEAEAQIKDLNEKITEARKGGQREEIIFTFPSDFA